MPPRFPTRYRNGFDALASGTAAYLRGAAGGDWQKKASVDQRATVSRDGMFVNVTREEGGPTRMYMAGFLNAVNEQRVFSSPDSLRWIEIGRPALYSRLPTFAPPFQASARRGVAILQDSGGDFGYLPGGVISPYRLDKFGLRWWDTKVAWIVAPRGIAPADDNFLALEQAIAWPSFQRITHSTYPGDDSEDYMQNPVEDSHSSLKLLPAGYWDNGGTATWYTGFTAIAYRPDLQQALHGFYTVDEAGYGPANTIGLLDSAPLSSFVCTLGPGRLLKLDTFYYPQKDQHEDHENPIDPPVPWRDMPRKTLALVSHSTDAGTTWAQVAAPILAAELAGMQSTLDDYSYFLASRGLPDDTEGEFLISAGTAPVEVWSAPLTRALSVVAVAVPYPTSGETWRWRVKLGTVGMDGVMVATQTLDEGSGAFVGRTLVKQLLALEGEVLVVLRDSTSLYTTPASIRSTTDGATLLPRGVMPAPEERCGPIMAASPSMLLVTVYEGATARLYRSRDRGATWQPHATISDAVRPQPGGSVPAHLTSLAVVERDGRIQSAFPATPWLTDCRIAHE
ncbi:hypothetical protein [Variovorax sp.]|jgi:hypothetical protein|uniref:hypothetical protein n=1 Tax=Variovorax sp. TaxID=1871043 RepID=UPI0037D9E19D